MDHITMEYDMSHEYNVTKHMTIYISSSKRKEKLKERKLEIIIRAQSVP